MFIGCLCVVLEQQMLKFSAGKKSWPREIPNGREF